MSIYIGIIIGSVIVINISLMIILYLICRATGCNHYCNKAGTCSGAEDCRAKSSFDASCFETRINIFKKFINRKRD